MTTNKKPLLALVFALGALLSLAFGSRLVLAQSATVRVVQAGPPLAGLHARPSAQ